MLVKTIKPYTRIKIPSIAAELNIPEVDVEALLVSLILDRKIEGRIDQVGPGAYLSVCRFIGCMTDPLLVYRVFISIYSCSLSSVLVYVCTCTQVNHLLILDAADDKKAKYEALDQWRDKLAALQITVINKISFT